MSSFRERAAELWQECANITREDIFGADDALRPVYKRTLLNWQIDVAAVGMVGERYEPGGIVILSVNPAGGKENYQSNHSPSRKQRSDEMYERMKDLRNADSVLLAFEESNKAILNNYPDWASMANYCNEILTAVNRVFRDIAYLHVVPFRTIGDKGSEMNASEVGKSYLINGFGKHLKRQLDILAPSHIITVDRPSEDAANRYQLFDRNVRVTYFTRGRAAHGRRADTLKELSAMYSSRCGGTP